MIGGSINRIRLEFKAYKSVTVFIRILPVLIESDWNLRII